jgi:hypothetical protein
LDEYINIDITPELRCCITEILLLHMHCFWRLVFCKMYSNH